MTTDYITKYNLDIKKYAYPDLVPLEQDWRWCHRYAYDVITGRIPACKRMKQVALRHFRDLQRDDVYFDEDAAKSIVLWFKFCPIIKGPKSGQPTVLDPSQIFLACSLIAWKWSEDKFEYNEDLEQEIQTRHRGKRRYNQFYGQVSRKYGKALALDTPIPTPSGWSTMGDLQVGDVVFDENGKQCNVIGVTDIQYNRTCYELTFSNGEKVTADADHQWFTNARSDNNVGSVKTTQQIFETLTYGIRGNRNHHIEMPKAIECDDVHLPIDPYLLGYWLGDGTKENSSITCGKEDLEHLYFQLERLNLGRTTIETRPGVYRVTPINSIDGEFVTTKSEFNMTKMLETLGVKGNKHIPDLYKRSSYNQRLALVQGLMDSDGTINKRGNQISFNQNPGLLFDDFCELIASLGIKYSVRDKFNKRFNSTSKECCFNTFRDEHQVFRLPRKLDRMKHLYELSVKSRSKTVSIVSCELVSSVPVKCISVDSPNKLYRFGKTMLPTHNTTFTAGLLLYLMYKYGFGPRVFSLATKRDQAKEVWNVAKKMIKLSPRLAKIFDPRANDILLPSKEGEFKPLASDSNSLDGLDPMAACLDECHAIKDRNLYGVLISAFGSNEGGEYLFAVITTAGFILDGLCTDLYKNGCRVLNPDDDLEQDNYFYAIFEIDEKDDWEDEKNWYKSNPALVYGRPSLQYMRDRYKEATMSVEEKANFLTKHCNLFVSGSDKWLDIDKFKACVKNLNVDDYRDRVCAIGFDRSQVSDITSASVLIPTPDGGCDTIVFNLQSEGALKNAGDYLRSIYTRAVESEDLELVQGEHIRNEHVKQFIRDIVKMFPKYEAVFYDPYHMKEIALELEDEGINMVSVSMGPGNVSEPAKKLEMLIDDELFRYHPSVLLEYAASCALISVSKFGNSMVYRDPNQVKVEKIDPLIATILALSGATLQKVEKNIYESRGMLYL